MRALRSKLTYANVISTLCLFLVLGGATAIAATQLGKNSVGPKQIRNGAVTGPKIKRSSIEATKLTPLAISTLDGQRGPKGAKGARGAAGAKGATGARGERGATGPQGTFAEPEPLRVVGQPGQPTFGFGWENHNPGSRPLAAFYLDRQGIVHLQGQVKRTGGSGIEIFVLPAGYAPERQQTFAAVGNNGSFAVVAVEPDGKVKFADGDPSILYLNGITWRAGK
jgi:hypothetical protein